MSKTNAKNQAPAPEATQEPAPTPPPAPAAAPAADQPAAVVQPAPSAAPPDEHHGRGGLYILQGGRRVRLTPPPATLQGAAN